MKKIKFKEWSKECPWYRYNYCLKESTGCTKKTCSNWYSLKGFKYDNAKIDHDTYAGGVMSIDDW